MSTGKPKSQVK